MEWIKGISPIEFPDLGLLIDPPSGVKIGSLSINFYGLLIAIGLMLAVVYAWKRTKEFGINEDHLTDGVLWIAPFAIICAASPFVLEKSGGRASLGPNPCGMSPPWHGCSMRASGL